MDTIDPRIVAAIIAGIIAIILVYWRISAAWQRQKDQQRHEKDLEWEKAKIAQQQEISEAGRTREKEIEGTVATEFTFEQRYLDYVYNSNSYLQIQGLPTHKPLSIDLEKIYVPLKAYDIDRERTRLFSDEDFEKLKDLSSEDEREWQHFRREKTEITKPTLLTEILKRHNKLVILGDPGSGKTTFLRYLAAAFAKSKQGESFGLQEARIPIVIALRDLKHGDLPSAEELPKTCIPKDLTEEVSTDPQTKEGFFKQNLKVGRCVVLLDGLDEVADKTARRAVSKWVMDLTHVYPDNRFVITSRILGYQDAPLGGGFRGYTLSNFERKDIERFSKNWYHIVETNLRGDTPESRKTADNRTNKLIEAIFNNDRVERLAVNPLMLSIIAIVHRDRGVLPQRRVRLYDDCIDVLLGRWDEAKGLIRRLTPEQKAQVLIHVARYLHANKSREIEATRLKELLASELQKVSSASEYDVDVFLEEIRERSGIIIDRGKDVFSFSHLTFQEYLTAKSLKEDAEGENFLLGHKDSSWWREVTLLYCGLKDATSFITKLLESEGDMFRSNLFFAGECLADCLSCSPVLRKKIQAQLFSLFDSGEYSLLKDLSRQTLIRIRGEVVEQEFIRRLNSPDSLIRERAVGALGAMRSEAAVVPLIEALKDENLFVPVRAAEALGKIGSKEAEEPLLEALKDGHRFVCQQAAKALKAISWEAAVRPLLASLKDADGNVRAISAEILGRTGSEEAVEPLIESLKDEDWIVRTIAADALGEMHSEAAVGPLTVALKDKDWSVRDQAAQALKEIAWDWEEVVTPLLEVLKDRDANIRANAALALGAIGSEAALDQLLEALKVENERERVRGLVARALGIIGSEEALEPLMKVLNNEGWYVRSCAAEALGAIGSRMAIEPLIEVLKDGSRWVRADAAGALGKVGNLKAIEPLTELLENEEFNVRDAAFRALYEIHKRQKE